MNIAEATAVNRLLAHLLGSPGEQQDARTAAASLACRAYKALGTGVTHADIIATPDHWPAPSTITARQLDGAARAMHDEVWPETDWDDVRPARREEWRQSARLAAAAFGLTVLAADADPSTGAVVGGPIDQAEERVK